MKITDIIRTMKPTFPYFVYICSHNIREYSTSKAASDNIVCIFTKISISKIQLQHCVVRNSETQLLVVLPLYKIHLQYVFEYTIKNNIYRIESQVFLQLSILYRIRFHVMGICFYFLSKLLT